jgi:hypothetical protein
MRFNLDYDSRPLMRGTAGALAGLAPYGAGIAQSMVRFGVDILTLSYRDQVHGLHEAVFMLPKGKGEALMLQLRSMNVREEEIPSVIEQSFPSNADLTKGASKYVGKGTASVRVTEIDTNRAALPPSFRAVLYEELIARLQGSRYFVQVLRAGEDRPGAPGCLQLRIVAESFKRGKPRAREITVVGGRARLCAEVQLRSASDTVMRDNLVNAAALGRNEELDMSTFLAYRTVKLVTRTH